MGLCARDVSCLKRTARARARATVFASLETGVLQRRTRARNPKHQSHASHAARLLASSRDAGHTFHDLCVLRSLFDITRARAVSHSLHESLTCCGPALSTPQSKNSRQPSRSSCWAKCPAISMAVLTCDCAHAALLIWKQATSWVAKSHQKKFHAPTLIWCRWRVGSSYMYPGARISECPPRASSPPLELLWTLIE